MKQRRSVIRQILFIGGGGLEREQTTIRLPVELKEMLQQEADKRGVSFNALVVWTIQKGLEKV